MLFIKYVYIKIWLIYEVFWGSHANEILIDENPLIYTTSLA